MGKKLIMKAILFYIIILQGFVSCYNKKDNQNSYSSKIETKDCNDEFLKYCLFKAVIDLPELQQYIFPQDWNERNQLIILQHPYFKEIRIDTISKFGKPIKLIDEKNVSDFLINDFYEDFLRFKSISQNKEMVNIELSYEIQGITCFITLKERSCEWMIINSDIAED